MSDRSMEMRLAILHAPGDEALAERVREESGFRDALTAPISSQVAFGDHLVLLVLWTVQAAVLEHALLEVARRHRATVVWDRGGGRPSGLDARVIVVGPESTAASIAPALRLAGIEGGRPADDQSAPRRAAKRGVVTAVLGIVITAAVGAAATAAVMMDGAEPFLVMAAKPQTSQTPSPDLRPTTTP